MTEKDKKEIKGYIKKLSDNFEKKVKTLDKNAQNRFEGYVEDVNDRFKATGEGMTGINEKLSRMEKTLDSHTEQIGAILMDSTEIKSKLNKIQLDVSLDLDKKVDKKHFVDLELRMRKLEHK